MDWLIYLGYVAIVALVVFLSIKIGKYVDVIDKKSTISGAFLGGVMLAAVTSLPELFTSISAIWVVPDGGNEMIIGNILGSDLINCAFLGVILLIFCKGLKDARFQKYYYVSIAVLIAMYGLVAIALYFGDYLQITWYNGISLAILVAYVLFIYKMPKSSESDEDALKDEKLTLKGAVVRFIICAVVLIGASVALTYVSDLVQNTIPGMGDTFAGALFLGIATSLPELISSVTLCARKNYDAAAGNIIGSNIFNFMILFVGDVLSFPPKDTKIYYANTDSKALLIFGAAATIVVLIMLAVKNVKKQSKGSFAGVIVLNVVLPAIYVLYLLIATGVITIPFLS